MTKRATQVDSDEAREQLLKLIRVRPEFLHGDDPDPSDDEYWEVPNEIEQRYYMGGAEVNLAKLADLIVRAGWRPVRRGGNA